ncbi:Armadillo-type fold [Phaffia rhodozyma]|uniref:Armadillo-type fold n=1 Tax=Phaffia rhodozyma TaxID=264483 RepID=A0A0F7SNW5_PHARH|nr:Armadillo-type fold [Phaffia rhodozyma]
MATPDSSTTTSVISSTQDMTNEMPAFKLKSRRSVIFSSVNQNHPYKEPSPRRPAVSAQFRALDSASMNSVNRPTNSPNMKAGDPGSSGILTPSRGILKRTGSEEIRLAKDVKEGTRINGRLKDPSRSDSESSAMVEETSEDDTEIIPISFSSHVGTPRKDNTMVSSFSAQSPAAANLSSHSIQTHINTLLSPRTNTTPSIHQDPQDHQHQFLVSLQDLAEAYTSLTAQFRGLPITPPIDNIASKSPRKRKNLAKKSSIDVFLRPLIKNAPALISAFTRDLSRLFTHHSPAPQPVRITSLARGDDSSPGSSSAVGSSERDDEDDDEAFAFGNRRMRRGFSEHEITRRREEVSVGHAVLKWLALLFHSEVVWSCFSDADILSLLRLLLQIPLHKPISTTDSISAPLPPLFSPTTASKRTYSLSIYALTHLRLPSRILQYVVDDILEAVKRACSPAPPKKSAMVSTTSASVAGSSLPSVTPAIEGQVNQKAKTEALGATFNLLSRNPTLLLPLHREWIPLLLRSLLDSSSSIRVRATAALAAVLEGGHTWLKELEIAVREASVGSQDQETREEKEAELNAARKVVEEEVALTVVKVLGKKNPVQPTTTVGQLLQAGKSEGKMITALMGLLKSTVDKEPHWAITTWSVLVSLLGRNVHTNTHELLDFLNVAKSKAIPAVSLLCRLAWDHVIHSIISQSSRRITSSFITSSTSEHSSSPLPDRISALDDLIIYDLSWCLADKRTALFSGFLVAVFNRHQPPSIIESKSEDGSINRKRWKERDGANGHGGVLAKNRLEATKIISQGIISLIYGYTGAILLTASPWNGSNPSSMKNFEAPISRSTKNLPIPKPTAPTGQIGTISEEGILVPSTIDSSFRSSFTSRSDSSIPAPSCLEVHDNLTKLMKELIGPLLTDHFLPAKALDEIKLLGWSILRSICNSSAPPLNTSVWELDRLLCWSFLNGDVSSAEIPSLIPGGISKAAAERENALWKVASRAAENVIRVDEIPAWPRSWIASRLSDFVVKLFEKALLEMRGLMDVEAVRWIKSEEGEKVIPETLFFIWKDILIALKSIGPDSGSAPSNLYNEGVIEITRCLTTVLKTDPRTYVPPSLEHTLNLAVLRLNLVNRLFTTAAETLGSSAFAESLPFEDETVLGAGSGGYPTTAGVLLTSLLGGPSPLFTSTSPARVPFIRLLESLLNVGVSGSLALNLLGDLTMNLGDLAVGVDEEPGRFELWRLFVSRWNALWPEEPIDSTLTVIQDQSINSDEDCNGAQSMTLGLLNDLLTSPFHRFPQAWSNASKEDIDIWISLLNTSTSRAIAKGMNPNIAVVEHQAAGLNDADMAKLPCVATIKCLSALISKIQYPLPSPPTHDTQLAFKRRMKNFPDSFIQLLRDCLDVAYTQISGKEHSLSHLTTLLKDTASLLKVLPLDFTGKAIELLIVVVTRWVRDTDAVLPQNLYDESAPVLYEAVLDVLSATSTTLEGERFSVIRLDNPTLQKIYPLLSVVLDAPSSKHLLVQALRSFWSKTFAEVEGLESPENLKTVLNESNMFETQPNTLQILYSPSQATKSTASPGLLSEDTSLEISEAARDQSYDGDISSLGTHQSTYQPNSPASQLPSESSISSATQNSSGITKNDEDFTSLEAPPSRKRRRGRSDRSSKRRKISPVPEDATISATPEIQSVSDLTDGGDGDVDCLIMEPSSASRPVVDSNTQPSSSASRSSTGSRSVLASVSASITRLFRGKTADDEPCPSSSPSQPEDKNDTTYYSQPTTSSDIANIKSRLRSTKESGSSSTLSTPLRKAASSATLVAREAERPQSLSAGAGTREQSPTTYEKESEDGRIMTQIESSLTTEQPSTPKSGPRSIQPPKSTSQRYRTTPLYEQSISLTQPGNGKRKQSEEAHDSLYDSSSASPHSIQFGAKVPLLDRNSPFVQPLLGHSGEQNSPRNDDLTTRSPSIATSLPSPPTSVDQKDDILASTSTQLGLLKTYLGHMTTMELLQARDLLMNSLGAIDDRFRARFEKE